MRHPLLHRLLKPLLLSIILPLGMSEAGAADDFPLVEAKEVRARAGWPGFFEKVQGKAPEIRVAFLGGSITAQEGWRPKLLAHWAKEYPDTTFTGINAAIGGTGSDLGVFRLEQDVLVQKPDLLLVEFAVNDGGADPVQIHRCMEGIVRQTWQRLPECDIGFVYTITEALVGPLLEGKFPRAASAMEQIAGHYQIPTIHMGMEVARLAKEGRLEWSKPLPEGEGTTLDTKGVVIFAPDSVHPHPSTGHELYVAALVRSFGEVRAASVTKRHGTLPPPFDATNYEKARLVPLSKPMLSDGFQALSPETDDFGKRWANRMKTLHVAKEPGETLTFRFKGTRCAIYDIIGPDCGQVVVTLDDQPARVVPRFDAYCTYHRLATLMIGTELEDKEHTVKIEIHPEQPAKAEILAKRNETMDKPERFDGRAFYPGAILLVGELLE